MTQSFVIRSAERGHDLIKSTGQGASYVAGHPDGYITRASSFNFGQYQKGRPGFGPIRVFGDEIFHGAGCGYNMHPHHNFVICAFLFSGELTHVNTAAEGMVDRLRPGDYYVFSAGAGGKHCELSVSQEDMQVVYLWLLPNQLYLPTTYHRSHFDFRERRHELVQLIGDGDDALPIPQDLRVSRLLTDAGDTHSYRLRSPSHGVYVYVREGAVRCNGAVLGRRDSIGLWEVEDATITLDVIEDDSDIFLVETIMIDDERFRDWAHEHDHEHVEAVHAEAKEA
ncbi:pirin family protein [Variovorax sp. OV329]|uniref:pirin family protein n=1 Tax=Variovorax sp. OV329 TaxID=1882825 RepID=UPI0008E36672|nr:pirin family protein [Variovorax sp. OV329]SFM94459.1 Redox-sensitive bicupin YhaK, pirin superfamily [Variovorax sp. OV329]